MPTDCSDGPIAPAAPKSSAAAMQRNGFQRAKMTSATAMSPCPEDRPWFQDPGYDSDRNAPPTPARKPPTVVVMRRTKLTEMPIARAAAALSPTVLTTSPQRVLRSDQASRIASAMPMKNSGLTCSALFRLASSVQNPKGIEPSRGGRLDIGLAEEERDADAKQHHGDAD